MNLNEFIPQAIRTESRIDVVKTNKEFLTEALIAFIVAGTLLDQVKKNVFYNKPFDLKKMDDKFSCLNSDLVSYETDEYYIEAAQQINAKEVIDVDPRVFHAIIGIMTESTELAEQLLAGVRGKKMDRVNLLEEGAGDVCWYQAILVDALGADWEEALQTVINKLRARYPDKFTNENAINRDLNNERKILEDGANK